MIIILSISAVHAENETVKNTHNNDINDSKYINENDYYITENGSRIGYTSDTGSFNNVTMSNGYNAYAIQSGGYLETNDSKTHPSFWNDTYYCVDANDTQTVSGHWHYAKKAPIGEYLKILFYVHYDDLMELSLNPDIPSSIYVQSMIWDFYENANNLDKLYYDYNKQSVRLYNQGFRVNNTGNIKWIDNKTYRVFSFMGFRNSDSSHKDLWGFKVELFNITSDNQTSNATNSSAQNKNTTVKNNKTKDNPLKNRTQKTSEVSKNTLKTVRDIKLNSAGNPVNLLIIIIIVILAMVSGLRIKK